MLKKNLLKIIFIFIVYLGLYRNTTEAQPISNDPSISISLFYGGVHAGAIRLDRCPADGNFYYITFNGNVYKIIQPSGGNPYDTLIASYTQHGINYLQGIAFKDSTMFLCGNYKANGIQGHGLVMKGKMQFDGSFVWDTLIATVPYQCQPGVLYDHAFGAICLTPAKDSILICSGSRTDHGEYRTNGTLFPGVREVPLTGKIFIVPIDTTNLILLNDSAWLDASGFLFAQGFRNNFDLAFAGNGDLFGVENSGDRDEAEEMNWLRTGHHYGFPWYQGGDVNPQQFPGYDPNADSLVNHASSGWIDTMFFNDPTFPQVPPLQQFTSPIVNYGPDANKIRDSLTREVYHADNDGSYISTFTAHRSPLGLVFDANNKLAGFYQGKGFVLSWNIGADSTGVVPGWGLGPYNDESQDLLLLELEPDVFNDTYVTYSNQLIKGFKLPIDAALISNKMYVMEYSLYDTVPSNIWVLDFPAASIDSLTYSSPDHNGFEISCNGGNDGAIDLTVYGGNAPYSFVWSNGETTEDVDTLTAGTYTVTVQDNVGNTFSISIVQSEPLLLNASIDSIVNITCFGSSDGSIYYTTAGGVNPYSFLWSNNATTEDLVNVVGGNYDLFITDANGCSFFDTQLIFEPIPLIVISDSVLAGCNGTNNGSVFITPQGGTTPYVFQWSNGMTEEDITGLPDGTYTITVTDFYSCTSSIEVVVASAQELVVVIDSVVNPLCFNQGNGAIYISLTGGIAPYSYLWSNTFIDSTLINVPAGYYFLEVTDANGCMDTISQELINPPPLILTFNKIDASCNSSNGSAASLVSGGTGSYSYLWNDGSTDAALNGLSGGIYTLTITDGNGCTALDSIEIFQQGSPLLFVVESGPVLCFGESSGYILTNYDLGTSPYNFLWSDGSTNQDLLNIPTGTYTLVITDANGCTDSVTQFISSAPQIIISPISTPASCGQLNGSADANASGGTGGLTYLWSNSETTSVISNIASGIYTVTVTDANNCSATATVNVGSSNGPDIIISSHSDVFCYGGNNGSILTSLTGGIGPYNYLWSNGATTDSIFGLTAGTYTVIVSDASGCTDTDQQIISQPDSIIIFSVVNPETCGNSNGEITLATTGGTGIITFLWSNGATDNVISGLQAGTYSVTVTDGNGCTVSSSIDVFNIPGPDIFIVDFGDDSCFNAGNGFILIGDGESGTPPFTFLWSNGDTNQNLVNVIGGTYTVTVTDANGCTDTVSQVINEPLAIALNPIITPASCGQSNGSADANASGGTGGLTYLWSNSETTSVISNIASGIYTVTVTDANNCSATATVNVGSSNGPDIIISSHSDVFCYGGNNGSILTSLTGGIGPYNYLWSNGATTDSIFGLTAGTYTVIVSDASGCTDTDQQIISQPDSIVIFSVVNPETCGNSNGEIILSTTGGTGSITFLWSTGSTDNQISGLQAGTYSVTVTDGNGCTVSSSIDVFNNPGPDIFIVDFGDDSCFNAGNGFIIIGDGESGTPPFTFLWSNGDTNQDLLNVIGGTYTVTVTDANGCTDTVSQVINEPLAIALNPIITPASCGQSNGSADANASGGTGNLTYLWSNSETTSIISNIASGIYTVTVTDANNCSATATVNVGSSNGPDIIISSHSDVFCYGGNNGSILTSLTGGIGPYNYLWSNGATTDSIFGLTAGTYTVIVSDASGCTDTDQQIISQPDSIIIFSVVNPETCGNSNGEITLATTGGTGSIAFLWSNGATDNVISGLQAGTYSVTVTDENACTVSSSIDVFNIPGPDIFIVDFGDDSCFNAGNGFILIGDGESGTPPFTFLWSNGDTNQNLVNVIGGTYTVTVTDANGCTDTVSQVINEPLAIALNPIITPASCGQSNGSADANASGGTGNLTYLWSNSETTSVISNIASGIYTVTVTDANNCSATATVNVGSSNGPDIIISSHSDVFCYGGNNGSILTSLTGGIGPYNYLWSNGATTDSIFGLTAGTYTVIVSDASGCTDTDQQIISQPDSIVIFSVVNPETCGNSNGEIILSTTGGTGSITFLWSTGSTDNQISGLQAGTYSVTVTDGNGCTVSSSIDVFNNPGPDIFIVDFGDDSCFNAGNGFILIGDGESGTPPFTFLWSNGDTNQNLVNVIGGTYTVTVTDANGCTDTISQVINEPLAIVSNPIITPASCGQLNGSADANASGGTGNLTYLWSNSETTSVISNIASGIYTVTVTDANNCSATATVNVGSSNGPDIIISSHSDVFCYGGNNGSILTSLTGGIGPYNYLWSNGATTDSIFGLTAGTYTVIVSDASGCTDTDQQIISQPDSIIITAIVLDESCNQSNGSISLTLSGGTGLFTFLWSNSSTENAINNLATGTYTVIATDANSCTQTETYTIQNTSGVIVSISDSGNIICHGGNDGFIKTTITGGAAPFSYLWSNGATSDSIVNIFAGTYTVTVIDANGCSDSTTATISEPDAISILIDSISATCNLTNGIAIAIVSGGTGPYTYLWSNNETTVSITGLAAGLYSVTVTDSNLCSSNATVTIGFIIPPAINAQITNNKCNNDSLGKIVLTVNGGVSPYNYNWSSGATTKDLINVAAGFYSVTVTDFTGCTVSLDSIELINPLPLLVSVNGLGLTCNQINGQVWVSATGGTGFINYIWNTGATSTLVTALAPGTYTVFVFDQNNCTRTSSVTIGVIQPQVVDSSIIKDVSCYGSSDGSIEVFVSSGIPPYSYAWSNGETTQNIDSLVFGGYALIVSDSTGCTQLFNFNVLQNDSLTINFSVTNPSCGFANGVIAASVTGGTNTYNYLWSNGSTNAIDSGLFPGKYYVTITDANNCVKNDSVEIFDQPGPTFFFIDSVSASCFGSSDGSVSDSVAGGTSPITFLWSNGSVSQNLNNIPAGTYTLTVSDGNGCHAVDSIIIGQPTQIIVTPTVSNPTCGNNNGFIQLNVSGGAGNYSYLWSNGETVSELDSLIAGTYIITVTDQDSCYSVKVVSLSSSNGPQVVIDSLFNESCFGDSTGAIYISVTGGITPYNFSWSNGETSQNIVGLPASTYSIMVTDSAGCQSFADSVLTEPSLLSSVVNATPSTCGFPNGSVFLVASGGTPNYTYVWSNSSTNYFLTNILPGNYSVTITDAAGCVHIDSTIVTGPDSVITVLDTLVENVNCYGDSTGSIQLNVAGGTSPYTYLWSNNSTDSEINNLAAGPYNVIITDQAGCTLVLFQDITQPLSPIAINLNPTDPVCGQDNGQISVLGSGGTSPYTYFWSNGSTNNVISNLGAGTFTVTITDSLGCSKSDSTTLVLAPALSDSIVMTESHCGNSDGTLTAFAFGGIPGYTFLWSDLSTDYSLTGLAPGTFYVTITDAVGCTHLDSAFVTGPDSGIVILDPVITHVNCKGDTTGAIQPIVAGGTPPYIFQWSTGSTESSIDSLVAGQYIVTVTDQKSCSIFTFIDVLEPVAALGVTLNLSDPKCEQNDGHIEAIVSGGTAPYTYSWSNGFTTSAINNLGAGTFIVTVTDSSGCVKTDTATLFLAPALGDSIIMTEAHCGTADGTLVLYYYGGIPNYNFLWSNGSTNSVLNNLLPGIYSVTITDAVGCTHTDFATVTGPDSALVVTDTIFTNIKCFGDSIGSIKIIVGGGTKPYSYLWSTGSTLDSVSALTAQQYYVTITDAKGCSKLEFYDITEPAELLLYVSPQNPTCGLLNGIITANDTGGVAPYQYFWSNGFTTQTISNLGPGIYTVTVTDQNGCFKIDSVTLTDPGAPSIVSDSIINVSCNGLNNGGINISVLNGSGNYNFQWSDGSTNSDISNVVAGTYTVILLDLSTGCTDTAIYPVNEPSALILITNSIPATCTFSNGQASVHVTGGSPSYSYSWNGGAITDTIKNIPGGTYTVTVTDNNGCTKTETVFVNNIGGPQVNSVATDSVDCFGESNGIISVTNITGGTLPYSFLWSNNETNISISGLLPGVYTVTVTDASNCSGTISGTIYQPDSIQLAFISNYASCGGNNGSANLIVSGGTLNYNYSWSNGSTDADLLAVAAGLYTVSIIDAHGCTQTDSVVISNPAPPLINVIGIVDVSCHNDSNGTINILPAGGQPFQYNWSNGTTNQILSFVPAGTYTVIVTDSANCTSDSVFTISQPDPIVSYITPTIATCNDSNGVATIDSVTGGTAPFTYLWSNGETTATIDSLFAGAYTVLITDSKGCLHTNIVAINNSSAPLITLNYDKDISCFNGNDGEICIHIEGSSPPYTITWTNLSQTDTLITNLSAGIYVATVEDAFGCKTVFIDTINQPDQITYIETISLNNPPFNISCHGANDGFINVSVSGGTAPFTYLWSTGITTQNILNIGYGLYSVTITDSHQCTRNILFTLTEPPLINAVAGTNQVLCGVYSTQLNADTAGLYGTGIWASDSASVVFSDSSLFNSNVSGLSFGNNILYWIVSDGVCSDTDQVIVSVNDAITALGGNDITTCKTSITLNATEPQPGIGTWSLIYGSGVIFDPSAATTPVSYLSVGANVFLWTVVNGTCTDADSVVITVRSPEDCTHPVEIPMGITPNGDGYNDYLIINHLDEYSASSITIYNRWGNIVFDQHPFDNHWDGTNNKGEKLPDGTYFIYLKVPEIDQVIKQYIDLRR